MAKKLLLSVYTVHVLAWAIFFWLSYRYFVAWLPQIGMAFTKGYLLWYLTVSFVAIYFIPVYLNHFLLLPRLYLAKRPWAYWLCAVVLVVLACIVKVQIDMAFITVRPEWLGTVGHYISLLPYLLFAMGLSSWQVMAGAHRAEKQRADALQQAQALAELKWLKAQVNPHFLFNALNNIYALVYVKSDDAGPMLLKLGEMMRYVMTEAGHKTVLIEAEVDYVRQYVELNGLKKSIREKTTLRIVNESSGVQVEPLLFINFIENAYKHCNIDDAGAWIRIDWQIGPGQILFECSNTYSAAVQKDATTGIGLRNVQQRLALAHPNHRLSIQQANGVYAVRLTIPLQG
jgi:hypothetical protein